jgi:hypothetical protein
VSAGLRVATAYPHAWRRQPELPLLAAEAWQRVMGGRLEGDPVWFWTGSPSGDDDVAAGLAGYVIRGPVGYPLSDAVRLVADPRSPFADAAPAPPDVPAHDLYPYLMVTHPGYATFPVGARHREPAAVGGLLDGMLRWAAGQRLRAVSLAFAESGSPLAEAAAGLGFRGPRVTADSRLTVPDGGFAGYLDALPGRRRRRLRGERRALHGRGLRGRRMERVTGPLLDRMTELRCQHRRRYGLAVDADAERARLGTTVDGLSDLVDVFVVSPVRDHGGGVDGAPVVCFGLFVRDGSTWHAVYTGSDYTDPDSRTAYFEAVYYAPVETAGSLGITAISYGLAADEAKRLRGCVSVPVSCLWRGLTGDADAAIDRIARAWRQPATADADRVRRES